MQKVRAKQYWLSEPTADQNAFQDTFKFKIVRIARGEIKLITNKQAKSNGRTLRLQN